MNEKAFEKVERDLNLATGEIKIMGAKGLVLLALYLLFV
jgi:hypothetical protein